MYYTWKTNYTSRLVYLVLMKGRDGETIQNASHIILQLSWSDFLHVSSHDPIRNYVCIIKPVMQFQLVSSRFTAPPQKDINAFHGKCMILERLLVVRHPLIASQMPGVNSDRNLVSCSRGKSWNVSSPSLISAYEATVIKINVSNVMSEQNGPIKPSWNTHVILSGKYFLFAWILLWQSSAKIADVCNCACAPVLSICVLTLTKGNKSWKWCFSQMSKMCLLFPLTSMQYHDVLT